MKFFFLSNITFSTEPKPQNHPLFGFFFCLFFLVFNPRSPPSPGLIFWGGREGEAGHGVDTEFALGTGSGGNFFLLLAVNKAQLASTRVGHSGYLGILGFFGIRTFSSAGTSSSFPPPPPTPGEGRGGAGGAKRRHLVFVLWFKEHLKKSWQRSGPWRGRRCCRQCSDKAREIPLCVPDGEKKGEENPARPSLSKKNPKNGIL